MNTLTKYFLSLNKIYEVSKSIEEKANLHYKLKLLEKVFLSFKNNVIEERGIEQVCNRNLKRLVDLRKNRIYK